MLCKYLFYYKSFRYAILKVTLAKKSLFEFPALILTPRQTPKLYLNFNNQYRNFVSQKFKIILRDITSISWLDLPFSRKSFFNQTPQFLSLYYYVSNLVHVTPCIQCEWISRASVTILTMQEFRYTTR